MTFWKTVIFAFINTTTSNPAQLEINEVLLSVTVPDINVFPTTLLLI